MYTLEQIAALRKRCNDLQLLGREVLEKYTDEELQVICNGIGPDAFPAGVRKFVTSIHPTLECCAFIHDVEWYEATGTKEHFTASNDRYAQNGIILAKAEYAWCNPVRYIVIAQGYRHARTCQLCGWEAYLSCYEQGGGNACG